MTRSLRFLATAALLLAAAVHLALIATHVDQNPVLGALFALTAAGQIAGGILLLRSSRPWVLATVGVATVGVLLTWLTARTVGIPALGLSVEPVLFHDGATAAAEAVAVVLIAAIIAVKAAPILVSALRATAMGILPVLALTAVAAGPLARAHEVHSVEHIAVAGVHLHGLSEEGEKDSGADPSRLPTSRLDVTTIAVGSQPIAIDSGFGAIWVANGNSGSVTRIDPTSATRRTIPVGGRPTDVTVAFGRVWVTDFSNDLLRSIDPISMTVEVSDIKTDLGPTAVFAAFGRLWVTTATEGMVHRINPNTRKIERSTVVGFGPTGIAAARGRIWIVNSLDHAVIALDPKTLRVSARAIPTGAGAQKILYSGGNLFVANSSDGTVSVIDPRTRAVAMTVTTDDKSQPGSGPIGLAHAPDGVWVANNHDKTLRTVDSTGQVGSNRFFSNQLGPYPIAVDAVTAYGSVWVTNFDGDSVGRLEGDN